MDFRHDEAFRTKYGKYMILMEIRA